MWLVTTHNKLRYACERSYDYDTETPTSNSKENNVVSAWKTSIAQCWRYTKYYSAACGSSVFAFACVISFSFRCVTYITT